MERRKILDCCEKTIENFHLTVNCQEKKKTLSSAVTFHSTSTAGRRAGRRTRPARALHAQLGRGIAVDSFFPSVYYRK